MLTNRREFAGPYFKELVQVHQQTATYLGQQTATKQLLGKGATSCCTIGQQAVDQILRVISLTDFHFQDTPGSHIVSPSKVAQLLGLSLDDLATSAGVHRSVLTARVQSPPVQALLRDTIDVLNAAKEACGEAEFPIAWLLNEPLSVFRQKTAWELIKAGRTEDVVAYLHSCSAGFVG